MLIRYLQCADHAAAGSEWQRAGMLMLLVLLAGCSDTSATIQVAGGDPERGKSLIQQYGCIACHAIPGLPHHGSNIGPPLSKIGKRVYLAGLIPNQPEQMVRWLRDPPSVAPQTAMPNLGVSEAEARDIAAYLYTLN